MNIKFIKTKILFGLVAVTGIAIGLVSVITLPVIGIQKVAEFIKNPVPVYATTDFTVQTCKKDAETTSYPYNLQVPVEVVKAEITKQAIEFNLDPQFMLNLAFCESGYNNLAANSQSTAYGVYQYLWGTWKATESFKNKHLARSDYKANIREAMIDISNGEHDKWVECLQ